MGAQGLTTFFPTHQPSLHGNTRYTHICSQPPIPTETQCSMQYATTCKHGNGTIYGHREREMGRGHRAGGWTDNHNIMQHPPVSTLMCLLDIRTSAAPPYHLPPPLHGTGSTVPTDPWCQLRPTIEGARGPLVQGRRLSEQERSARNPTLR